MDGLGGSSNTVWLSQLHTHDCLSCLYILSLCGASSFLNTAASGSQP